jgi:hypothetical protein
MVERVQVLITKVKAGAIQGLPAIFILIGCFLFILGYLEVNKTALRSVFFSAGSATLASGVFASILKSLQVLGIFREELVKIIFFDESFLKQRGDIRDIWKNTTKAIVGRDFPILLEKIPDPLLSSYLPSSQDFYYDRYSHQFNISWKDKEKSLIKVVDILDRVCA